jgi:hypothetical protein
VLLGFAYGTNLIYSSTLQWNICNFVTLHGCHVCFSQIDYLNFVNSGIGRRHNVITLVPWSFSNGILAAVKRPKTNAIHNMINVSFKRTVRRDAYI